MTSFLDTDRLFPLFGLPPNLLDAKASLSSSAAIYPSFASTRGVR